MIMKGKEFSELGYKAVQNHVDRGGGVADRVGHLQNAEEGTQGRCFRTFWIGCVISLVY